MKETDILVSQKVAGSGTGVFAIAKIGINHSGSLAQAERLVCVRLPAQQKQNIKALAVC
jgi:sialic acid synthase SpsE